MCLLIVYESVKITYFLIEMYLTTKKFKYFSFYFFYVRHNPFITTSLPNIYNDGRFGKIFNDNIIFKLLYFVINAGLIPKSMLLGVDTKTY